MSGILVLYYSRTGSVEALARQVARGVERVPGAIATIRTVPPVSPVCEATAPEIPQEGPAYATRKDLAEADGIVLINRTAYKIF